MGLTKYGIGDSNSPQKKRQDDHQDQKHRRKYLQDYRSNSRNPQRRPRQQEDLQDYMGNSRNPPRRPGSQEDLQEYLDNFRNLKRQPGHQEQLPDNTDTSRATQRRPGVPTGVQDWYQDNPDLPKYPCIANPSMDKIRGYRIPCRPPGITRLGARSLTLKLQRVMAGWSIMAPQNTHNMPNPPNMKST